MDQSLIYRLIFGTLGCLITLFIYYVNRKSNLSASTKFGFFIILLFFVQLALICLLLLNSYDLVPVETLGAYHPIKQMTTKIRYEYYYNGKAYSSSADNEKGVIQKGGRYYVRVVKICPSINEIDFSMPVAKGK